MQNKNNRKFCTDTYWKRKAFYNYDYDLNEVNSVESFPQKYSLVERWMTVPLDDPSLSRMKDIYFWNKRYQHIFDIPDLIGDKPNEHSKHYYWSYFTIAQTISTIFKTKRITWDSISRLFDILGYSFVDLVSKYGLDILVTRKKRLLTDKQQNIIRDLIVTIIPRINDDEITEDLVIRNIFHYFVIEKRNNGKMPEYDSILFILNRIIPLIEPNWLSAEEMNFQDKGKRMPPKVAKRIMSEYHVSAVEDMINLTKNEPLSTQLTNFIISLDKLVTKYSI